MEDPRLRLIAAGAVSCAAFVGLAGAVLALGWWFLFTPNIRLMRSSPAPWAMLVLILATGTAASLSGGSGFMYSARMGVILLIAVWVYADHRPGEFLDLAGSLFGTRAGFELGLVAELGMDGVAGLRYDASMVRHALRIKGAGFRSYVTALAATLLTGQLERSVHIADHLRIRGYTSGGSICPRFMSTRRDQWAAIAAIAVLVAAVAVSGEVFIVAYATW